MSRRIAVLLLFGSLLALAGCRAGGPQFLDTASWLTDPFASRAPSGQWEPTITVNSDEPSIE